MNLEFITVPALIVICYLIGQIVKVTPLNNKFIPVICGAFGGILGAVAFTIGMPKFPAEDIISAIAVGVASGFAATGINQVYKQLFQIKDDDDNFGYDEEDDDIEE